MSVHIRPSTAWVITLLLAVAACETKPTDPQILTAESAEPRYVQYGDCSVSGYSQISRGGDPADNIIHFFAHTFVAHTCDHPLLQWGADMSVSFTGRDDGLSYGSTTRNFSGLGYPFTSTFYIGRPHLNDIWIRASLTTRHWTMASGAPSEYTSSTWQDFYMY